MELFIQSSLLKDKSTVVHNKERIGSLANIYNAIHQIEPHKVIICVDGDDWLAHPRVLEKLASVYANPNVWMTFGSFDSEPSLIEIAATERRFLTGWNTPYPKRIREKNTYRRYWFLAVHLKTFYAGLFQHIKKEDFLWNGVFFPMAGDLALMIPLLEMATEKHIRFISEILYKYNIRNPISDRTIDSPLQKKLTRYIKAKPRYKPLYRLW